MMKKTILILAAVLLSFGRLGAQDMAQATETYNNGVAALQIDQKAEALKYFQEALQIGKNLGEEAGELIANCKNAIPGVILSIGKDFFNAHRFDEAIAKFQEAGKTAKEYGVADVLAECEALIPQAGIQKDLFAANEAYEAKQMKAAIEGYMKVLAADTANATASIRLIQSLAATGDLEGARQYMPRAEANGQGKNAGKVLGTAFLKRALAGLKAGKYAEAIDNAVSANEFAENPQTYQIAGQAAMKLNRTADAIGFFQNYLEKAPKAKNAGAIALTVGALYQGQKKNAKAIEYYKLAKEYGQDTQKYIDALSK